jgi:tRNA threonylcarbamoyladenosine biosynthesis protein TsaE
MIELEIRLPAAADTRRLGATIAQLLVDGQPGQSLMIALLGPLGAGKTTFAQGVGEALGVQEPISSPTFTMLNEFNSGALPLYHLDLYRLGEGNAPAGEQPDVVWLEQELDEISAGPGLVLIEWAELYEYYIKKQDHLQVALNYDLVANSSKEEAEENPDRGRLAVLRGRGVSASQIVEQVKNVYFS